MAGTSNGRKSSRNSAAISARFSAAADTYDDHADIQRDSALVVMELVGSLEPPRRILDVGCGTGVLTAMVADHFRKARIVALDISPNAVGRARAHFAGNPMIKCRVADARSFRTMRRFPLIVSNASLHWMEPLADTFRNLAGLLSDGGVFAFSIMLSGTLSELRESRLRVAPHKPPRGGLPTRQAVLAALDRAGLSPVKEHATSISAEYPSARGMLDAIHHIGVTAGPVPDSPRRATLLTRGELMALMADYAKHYSRPDGGVWATFEIMYVLASRTRTDKR